MIGLMTLHDRVHPVVLAGGQTRRYSDRLMAASRAAHLIGRLVAGTRAIIPGRNAQVSAASPAKCWTSEPDRPTA
jgi:hypothetical protein